MEQSPNINGVFAYVRDVDDYILILVTTLFGLNNSTQGIQCIAHVFFIGDGKSYVNPPCGVDRIVDHRRGGHGAVGDAYHRPVPGGDLGGAQRDLLYRAAIVPDLDGIADDERLVNEDKDARDKIGRHVLGRKAHDNTNHTGRSEQAV